MMKVAMLEKMSVLDIVSVLEKMSMLDIVSVLEKMRMLEKMSMLEKLAVATSAPLHAARLDIVSVSLPNDDRSTS